MAKIKNVGKKQEKDWGKTLDYPDFVHYIDSYGNIFCSVPDMDRIFPQYHTLSELEDAWRWRETDMISETDLQKLAKEVG